jgi:hypothetical protein
MTQPCRPSLPPTAPRSPNAPVRMLLQDVTVVYPEVRATLQTWSKSCTFWLILQTKGQCMSTPTSYTCALVASPALQDVYQYLAYWFTQWLSPIASVAATAHWLSSGQNGAASLMDLQVSSECMTGCHGAGTQLCYCATRQLIRQFCVSCHSEMLPKSSYMWLGTGAKLL